MFQGWVGRSRLEYFCPKLLSSKISVTFGGGFDTCGIWLWWIYKANGKTTTSSRYIILLGFPIGFKNIGARIRNSSIDSKETKRGNMSTWILLPIYVKPMEFEMKYCTIPLKCVFFLQIDESCQNIRLCETIVWKFCRSLLRKSIHMRFNGCIILLLS